MTLLNTTDKVASAYEAAAEKVGVGVSLAVPLTGARAPYEMSEEGLRREIAHRKEEGPRNTLGATLGGIGGGLLGGPSGALAGAATSRDLVRKASEAGDAASAAHRGAMHEHHERVRADARKAAQEHLRGFQDKARKGMDAFRRGEPVDMHPSSGGGFHVPHPTEGLHSAFARAERAGAEAFRAHGGEAAEAAINRRVGLGGLAGTALGVGGGILAGKALAKHIHNRRIKSLETEMERTKHASIDEIYKEAGFDKEAINFAPVGDAISAGAKWVGHQVQRAGGAMQRSAFQASKGVPTQGQTMLHSAGQGVRNLGKGIAANPGTAAGVAGAGLAAAGAGAVAGRMTAPRQ